MRAAHRPIFASSITHHYLTTMTKMYKPTILLVEDSETMRRFLALFLSKKYAVTTCASAEEAISLIEGGFRPNLIVTDLELPGMSGLRLIQILSKPLPFTPLLMLSGVKESKARIEALAAGADDFLAKPFHPAELDVRIGKLLRRSETAQSAPTWSEGISNFFRKNLAVGLQQAF